VPRCAIPGAPAIPAVPALAVSLARQHGLSITRVLASRFLIVLLSARSVSSLTWTAAKKLYQ
jgi:hypothetical protein